MTHRSFIVAILCHMIYATSSLAKETHYVFSLAVTYDAQEFSINFSMDRFVEFYRCLCQTTTASCTAFVELHKVIYIQENHLDHYQTQFYTYYSRHVCQHVRYENAVTCSKLQESQVNCSNTQNCLAYGIPNGAESTCSFGRADLVWKLGQHVSGSYVYGMIDVKPCLPECTVVNMETTTHFDNTSLTSFSDLSTVLPFGDDVANSNNTLLTSSGSDEESKLDNVEDNTSMVVGVLGVSMSLVFLAIIIGVFLWRRRKSSPIAKASKDIAPITTDSPTLIQLHHIDVIYANDDTLYAGTKTSNINSSTDVELDSCWSERFSDYTEYEPDFSDFYSDSNFSLEEPRISAHPSQETQSQIYENYTRPMKVCLCNSQPKFNNCLSRDGLDGQNVAAVLDDLIYEDFDRSGFDQVVEENSGSEKSTCSNITSHGEFTSVSVSDVKERSLRNTARCLIKPGQESRRSQDQDDDPDPREGYSKLNEDLSIIKESYNNLTGSVSLDGKSGTLPKPAVSSPEDSYQSAEQMSRYSLTYDPVEVIEVSPRLHIKNVPAGFLHANDQISPTKCNLTKKKSLTDVATTQTQETSHFKKARAYFELESHFKNKQQGGGMSVRRQANNNGDRKETKGRQISNVP